MCILENAVKKWETLFSCVRKAEYIEHQPNLSCTCLQHQYMGNPDHYAGGNGATKMLTIDVLNSLLYLSPSDEGSV
jgi:hypothetical protein